MDLPGALCVVSHNEYGSCLGDTSEIFPSVPRPFRLFVPGELNTREHFSHQLHRIGVFGQPENLPGPQSFARSVRSLAYPGAAAYHVVTAGRSNRASDAALIS